MMCLVIQQQSSGLRHRRGLGLMILLIIVQSACLRRDTPTPEVAQQSAASSNVATDVDLFAEASSQIGLNFRHQSGGETPHFMPRSIGSGCAVLDYDDDGLLDLLFLQNGGPQSGRTHQLYHQLPDHTFRDVSAGSGLDVDGYGMGVAVGDVNNDGRVDVVITEFGAVRLFLNQSVSAVPKFREITERAQLFDPTWATSATFLDYDRDTYLDLMVVNYVNYDPSRWCSDAGGRRDFCGPQTFPPLVARLFRNTTGEQPVGAESAQREVRFQDITVPSGIASVPGAGLGVTSLDVTGDHWTDIFVANDGMANYLWINQRDGTFREEATQRGIAFNRMGEAEADMGIALGDVNSDGMIDVFVTHRNTETHTLWSQTSVGNFVDATPTWGILQFPRSTGFGTMFGDWDNDGDLDLALSNGDILRQARVAEGLSKQLDPFWHPYAQHNQLFLNAGNGKFVDASHQNVAFCGVAEVSRGLATADINNDGHLDLLTSSIDGPGKVFLNQAKTSGNWLVVRAVDQQLQRDAYGAEIRIRAGDQQWIRVIQPGASFLSSSDHRAHFGFGPTEAISSMEVTWPDGVVESFPPPPLNQIVILQRSTGTVIAERQPVVSGP